ncbi:MAG: hypothetical protein ACJ8A6_14110 [Gemmatimonadales bacterium]
MSRREDSGFQRGDWLSARAPGGASEVTSRPAGLVLLALFFAFGTLMSAVTALALAIPGKWSEQLWRLNPGARTGFQTMGHWAVPLMLLVAATCAGAAIGLWVGKLWGHRLAVAVISLNLAGDVINAAVRGDRRTLIGLPIGGAMIVYLVSRRIRERFKAAG